MMTIERLRTEGAITFKEAAVVVGSILGSKPAKTTLIRWHAKGTHGVRLAAHRVGSCFYTTRQAVEEFVMAYSLDNAATRCSAAVVSEARRPLAVGEGKWGFRQRAHEIEQAQSRLQRKGLRFLLVCC
jgi:hypothetical protein